ncbi:o-succinylbenzoate synthase [Mangrovivirga sp. M17]|uniref:O-succinylbenzoate synthase n=1 Tax=Mangrovivirga halotolerans TaxID=2993936 RepID=A0ABT3RSQ8_9BACT|nr:o-succinylbenzoate synthase [Mangrovivirga halotolerans]MCX2744277.1 o-succinylbenzoate synthase [Mangrovivirga halotolerans]
MKIDFLEHTLQFKFDAGTSRGVMREHNVVYVILTDPETELKGIGECAPLPGLSVDNKTQVIDFLKSLKKSEEYLNIPLASAEAFEIVEELVPEDLPSVRFGLETALLDLISGGKKEIYEGEFYQGQKRIPINGLIWMGDEEFMLSQIRKKIDSGFNCLKMKIGAIDFETELNVLNFIRRNFSEKDLTVRVDANGAFSTTEALSKLEKLSKYDLHSIEQPIKPGNIEGMRMLCKKTPLPIALDEELIAVDAKKGEEFLTAIEPQYIILKPTLLGGLKVSDKWIKNAEKLNIDWWMTSALESNIGLNAISQFTAYKNVILPQGLGTGQLYHNNIDSPLTIENGEIFYDKNKKWDLSLFKKTR